MSPTPKSDPQPTEAPGTEPIALYPQHGGAPVTTVTVPVIRPRIHCIRFGDRFFVRNANGRYEESGIIVTGHAPDADAVVQYAESDIRHEQAAETAAQALEGERQRKTERGTPDPVTGEANLPPAESPEDGLREVRRTGGLSPLPPSGPVAPQSQSVSAPKAPKAAAKGQKKK